MIPFIAFQTLFLVLSSTLLGSLINHTFKLNINVFFNLIIGFILILVIYYLSGIVWVLYRLSPSSYYLFNFGIIGLLMIISIIKIKKFKFLQFRYMIFGIVLVLLLITLTLRYSFGIRSFDAVVYMSSVLDNINAPFLNAFNPYDGKLQSLINVENDFQSYYHMNSSFLWLFTLYQTINNLDFYPSLSTVYLISMTLFYFVFLYHLILGTIQTFKLKSKYLIVFIVIYFFVYFTSIYYNSSLSFLGQAYRTLIVAFMTQLVYLNLNKQLSNKASIILLSLSSFATISTSSSAYFIVFIILFAWLFIKVKEIDSIEYVRYCVIAALPIGLFVLLFLFSNFNMIGLYLISYVGLCAFIYRFAYFFKHFKTVVQYIVPISITVVSLITIYLNPNVSITHIFTRASRYDMVWDYFSFHNLNYIFFNTLIWISLVHLLTRSNTLTKNYFLTLIIVFINPLNFVFMTEFLAGSVVHRVFDVLFNPVALIWMFSLIEVYLHRYVKFGLIGILLLISIQSQSKAYHFVFNLPENSSTLDRINQNELDIMNVLNTKIILEDLDRPKVISQIFYIKAFVKQIELPLSYGYYRKLDVYDEVVTAPNELWNIFMVREYETMRVFDTIPDSANVCNYLIEEKVDFVLVDRSQYYRDGEAYVPIFFRVRGCGTMIYENDDYILYQFYW